MRAVRGLCPRGRTADQDVPVVAGVVLVEQRAARRQRHPAHRMRQLQLQRLRHFSSEGHLAGTGAEYSESLSMANQVAWAFQVLRIHAMPALQLLGQCWITILKVCTAAQRRRSA